MSAWAATLRTSLQGIDERFDVDDRATLTVHEDIEDNELNKAITGIYNQTLTGKETNVRLNFAMGRLINHTAAKREIEIEQVISELDLCRDAGGTLKQIIGFARGDQKVPEEHRYFGLTWTHYIRCVLEIKGPDDPDELRKFDEQRFQLLREASLDPKTYTSNWIKKKTLALRDSYGLKPKRGGGTAAWKDRMITACMALLDWNDEDFKKHGTTRAEALAWRADYEAKLNEANALPNIDDPKFRFPWQEVQKMGEEKDASEEAEPIKDSVEIEAEVLPESVEELQEEVEKPSQQLAEGHQGIEMKPPPEENVDVISKPLETEGGFEPGFEPTPDPPQEPEAPDWS